MVLLRPLPRFFPTHDAPRAEILSLTRHPPTAPPPSVGIATNPTIVGGTASNVFATYVPASNPQPQLMTHRALPPPAFPLLVAFPSRTSTNPMRIALPTWDLRLHLSRALDLSHLLIMLTPATSFVIGYRVPSSTPSPTLLYSTSAATSPTTLPMPRSQNLPYPPSNLPSKHLILTISMPSRTPRIPRLPPRFPPPSRVDKRRRKRSSPPTFLTAPSPTSHIKRVRRRDSSYPRKLLFSDY